MALMSATEYVLVWDPFTTVKVTAEVAGAADDAVAGVVWDAGELQDTSDGTINTAMVNIATRIPHFLYVFLINSYLSFGLRIRDGLI
jgi:hypothetical protein